MTTTARFQDSKRILLVEDEPSDVELILHAFQKIHLADEVAVVRDGAEALDYLFGTGLFAGRSTERQPKVILLDLHMPRLNGIEVLDRIRTDPRTRYLPVVTFTASDSARDLTASYLSGTNSCVRKPEDFSAFAETLRQIWLYWSEINQLPPPPGPQHLSQHPGMDKLLMPAPGR